MKSWEREVDLVAPVLSPVPFNPKSYKKVPYPYPELHWNGATRPQTLTLVGLENEYLRLEVCPSLGGRLVTLVDVASGFEYLPRFHEVTVVADDSGALHAPIGISWFDSNDSMGSVDWHRIESSETEASGIVLSGCDHSTGCRWRVAISLSPGDPFFRIERQTYADRHDCPIGSSIVFHSMRASNAPVFLDSDRGAGIAALCEDDPAVDQGRMVFGPNSESERPIGTVQTDITTFLPFRFEPGTETFGSGTWATGAFLRAGDALWLWASEEQSLEIEVGAARGKLQLKLGSRNAVSLPELANPACEVKVEGARLLGPEQIGTAWHRDPILHEARTKLASGEVAGTVPRSYLPGSDAESYQLRAIHSMIQQDWAKALLSIDRSLEIYPRNHRTWWLRAVCMRQMGDLEDPSDLLQAHDLWPSDPLVQAESYLRIPVEEGRDVNPIVQALSTDPYDALQAIVAYARLGLVQDVVRLAQQVLQVTDSPMIRLVLGYSMLKSSRFAPEAAEHVRRAGLAQVQPPFPVSPYEGVVLRELVARFPDQAFLAEYLSLVDLASR